MGDNTASKNVFTRFFDALVDISVNEKTVHFSKTSEIAFDGIYSRFEKVVLNENSKFVKKLLETA
jgi:hypothetical protein